MGTYRDTFTEVHTFLVVIHVESQEQALRNVGISVQEGADGVFLINHSMPYTELLDCYAQARLQFPDLWVGMNLLDVGQDAFDFVPRDTAGLWVDDPIVDEGQHPTMKGFALKKHRKASGWQGIYFGCVAFKYQRPIHDVGLAAALAVPFMDVITTSGEGTGKAANIDKIRAMKEAIGTHPLAIASGITPENIHEYLPYADCFLVATGISDSHTELNPSRVRRLARVLGK